MIEPIRRCPTCGHQLPLRRGMLDDRKFDAFMLVAKGKYKPYWYKWRLYVGGAKNYISDFNIRTSTGRPLSRVYFTTEITKALKEVFGMEGSAETLKRTRSFSGHFGKKYKRPLRCGGDQGGIDRRDDFKKAEEVVLTIQPSP